MRNLAAMPELADLRVIRADSAADACKGADIVTTVTADKRNAVILTPPMIAPGMHINGVGGDCPGKTELHPDILRMPDMRVVVEFEPQSRIEGEIQQMPPDYPVIELAQVVRGEAVARRTDRDITLFDSVGFALEDYSSLRFLHWLISQQRLGRRDLDLCRSSTIRRTCTAARSRRQGAARSRGARRPEAARWLAGHSP